MPKLEVGFILCPDTSSSCWNLGQDVSAHGNGNFNQAYVWQLKGYVEYICTVFLEYICSVFFFIEYMLCILLEHTVFCWRMQF